MSRGMRLVKTERCVLRDPFASYLDPPKGKRRLKETLKIRLNSERSAFPGSPICRLIAGAFQRQPNALSETRFMYQRPARHQIVSQILRNGLMLLVGRFPMENGAFFEVGNVSTK
ncbi:hypothetical protein AVEN_113190-1 [Araneus ventricosus]|uniref:Uncharacterized protein n=1 Tax=Araneus ventricosus TaxID=182803 RepID=A0A4Y2DQH9_ARAVE|nr:hypothetical protein AVEN_113190-1 [Araneus ventricosus]